jgi:hypothetical protein
MWSTTVGTLANFTLSERREILEKSSVNEILQDSLLRSPLSDALRSKFWEQGLRKAKPINWFGPKKLWKRLRQLGSLWKNVGYAVSSRKMHLIKCQQYSRFDLTMDLYAKVLVSVFWIGRFRLKKPMILFAFEVMLLIWVSQFMSFEIVMPRYFAVVSDSRVWHRQIYNHDDSITLQQDLDNLAAWEKMWGMQFHPENYSIIVKLPYWLLT